MNNQEILDNAPEGATHVLFQSINYIYIKFGVHTESFMYCNHKEGWRLATHVFHSNLRALSDIKRIVELEAENKLLHIELGATQHAFTDYRASYAMKACMMCNSLERVHCYANTEKLEAKVAELEKEREAKSDFQQRVIPWMDKCFGPEISSDAVERNHRFLEESLELVQALGCTSSEAHQLVAYVYGRPLGEPFQEVGGVMVTLAALCIASNLDMHKNGETELARIWTMVEKIRAKQAVKPKHSPLPEALKEQG